MHYNKLLEKAVEQYYSKIKFFIYNFFFFIHNVNINPSFAPIYRSYYYYLSEFR